MRLYLVKFCDDTDGAMTVQMMVLLAAVVGMLIAALIVIAPGVDTQTDFNVSLLCDVAKSDPDYVEGADSRIDCTDS